MLFSVPFILLPIFFFNSNLTSLHWRAQTRNCIHDLLWNVSKEIQFCLARGWNDRDQHNYFSWSHHIFARPLFAIHHFGTTIICAHLTPLKKKIKNKRKKELSMLCLLQVRAKNSNKTINTKQMYTKNRYFTHALYSRYYSSHWTYNTQNYKLYIPNNNFAREMSLLNANR